MARKKLDLKGENFGRLGVIQFYDVRKSDRRSRWLCKCECGNEVIAVGSELKRGNTLSCGCLTKEKRVEMNTTHGYSRESIYKTWEHMLSRCNDKNHDSYENYGNKGIKVCLEWYDIGNFVKWANENGYKKGLTIDRIDNERGYYPDNCVWSTAKEQANNRSTNLIIEHKGTQRNLTQWAEFYGLKPGTVFSRYYRGSEEINYLDKLKGRIYKC